MQDKRYIICGNAPTDGIEENPDRDLRLRLWGKDGPDKITLRIEDIHKKMSKDVPDSFQDLLEIATYVYSADQAIPRGADDVDSFGHGWRRDLHFIIPVRKPDFWNGDDIHQALRSTLGFLSDDNYHFEFVKLKEAQAFQGYLKFDDDGRLSGLTNMLDHPEVTRLTAEMGYPEVAESLADHRREYAAFVLEGTRPLGKNFGGKEDPVPCADK